MSKKKKKNEVVELSTVKSGKPATTSLALPNNGYWLAILAIVLPLLFSKFTSDPILPIRFICLSLFCLLFTIWFVLIKKNSFSSPLPLLVKLVFVAGILFSIISCISTFSSVNPGAGMFETARQFVMLVLLGLCLLLFIKEPDAVTKVCKAIAVAAILQSLVGILQFYEVAFTEIPGAEGAEPFGLMANRNLFGSAQMLVIPFVLYLIYTGNKFWRAVCIISFILLSYSLILSQTRSAWLGTMAILLTSLVLAIVIIRKNIKKWLLNYTIAIVIIAGIGILAVVTDKEGKLSSSIKERMGSIIGYTQKTENADSMAINVASNASERFKIWKKTVLLIKDHPLLGVGNGNWKLKIPEYGTEGTAWESGKVVPDRPHNVYLQVTAETGITGAIFYFGMWVLIAICGLLSLKKGGDDTLNWLNITMLSGIVALGVDAMFSFPTERIEHTLYISLMGAILLSNYFRQKMTEFDKKMARTPYLLAFIFMIIAAIGIFIGNKKYDFEKQLPLAVNYQKTGKSQEAIDAAEEGGSQYVTVNEEGKSLEVYSSLAYMDQKKYPEAMRVAGIALKYNPNSAMVYNNIGAIYANRNNYDSASIYYKKALRIKPKFEETLKNLAGCYYNLKKYDSCISTLQKLRITNDSYVTRLMNDAKLLQAAALKADSIK